MAFITAIGTAAPENCFNQTVIADFMIRAMHLDTSDARKLKAIFRSSGIKHRRSVLSDYGKDGDYAFFPNDETNAEFPSTQKRIARFREEALPLSVKAIDDAFSIRALKPESITHLITVSCTGMYAPGLDIDIIKHYKLPTSTQRIAITFMGCYAAINALRTAASFCGGDPNAKVLIVCTELCSLHFQQEPSDDNLMANALFADGAAAAIVEAVRSTPSLQTIRFDCDLLTEGEADMAWTVGDLGFEMKLSAYVPEIIRSRIGDAAKAVLTRSGLSFDEIKYFAIHPGGKRILKVIEEQLGLSPENNVFAHEVLKEFGNMSSPTILFVLREIMNVLTGEDEGANVLGFAFGPGLTVESVLLTANVK